MEELIDNERTDKQMRHNYLSVYGNHFEFIRNRVKAVLEIGIDKGGSLLLWERYFPNAKIYGVDIQEVPKDLEGRERIILFPNTNAYDSNFVKQLEGLEFDIIIDDGSHNLEDMKSVIHLYAPLLKKGGSLYIEDLKDESWIAELALEKVNGFSIGIQGYDLRRRTGNDDSLLACINYYKITEEEMKQVNKIKSIFRIE